MNNSSLQKNILKEKIKKKKNYMNLRILEVSHFIFLL